MRIAEILRRKGSEVATVRPDSTVRELLATLAAHNIGAVVVSSDGVGITGIVSERDVVRSLHLLGTDLLDAPVSQIMTADVRTCDPDDLVEGLRRTMTDHRVRHLPVVRDGRLVGIVSIGDVVKSAISELATEREHLVGYLQGTY
ncbi:CBS domain-containing protein [Nocardia cyriacigeorgica]|uniref:CBS domain-containing protein n=1 Tax=Nocardia cyriacigeorgica TaxID=135487 RepID=A0A6P1DBC9_9NOCA|nr:CBS domain-containing protein [Nocardia cyriacigeorgica]NEW37929.1 CBS domain-containing protein [Nocardia cyriacigeorgica]NEW47438.1 CBS domain-containing protein [Nocardia cyriacigeorgica]NEW48688.1 CBS domain-containing protein [Nocardia cyriacigeorgica]NEW56396.1 CBS domain-containing protein [Nocardia cyriacigeorgica]